jgi:pimeloyl-ACP methyl ester carboxylesterase
MPWMLSDLWPGAAFAVALALFSSVVPHDSLGETDTSRPAFQQTTCDLPRLSSGIAPRLRCGTVSVPRDYDHPDRGLFKLSVVVVRSAQQPVLPDPVVYISGGPGFPLTIYADYQARHPYAESRDLILVDQRGVGRSEPNLCPTTAGALLEADFAVAARPTAEQEAQRRSTFMACRDEARARGIDLNDFGTAATAEDFERVRQAFGITRWNVIGESYGTTVAMTLMAHHPDTIRSAVLDSVYPPDPLRPWSARVAEARAAFFAMCEGDAACAAAYPDLAGLYQHALERLGREPLTVAVPLRMHLPGNRALLTASAFELIVAQLLYYPDNYADLPQMIAAVHDSKPAKFAATLAALLAGAEALNIPACVAVECRDRPHFHDTLVEDADPLDRAELHGICSGWSDLGPTPVIPVDTDIPTLVLAGQFDPNASPSLSHHVADLIGGHARWIEFPLLGHAVRHFSTCAAAIVVGFIDSPDRALDTSCTERPVPIHFLPR